MTKQLQFNMKAQYSIKKGVDTLTNAVKVTIGPKGRNVVLDHPLEAPKVLNDGVTIARGIDLEEPFTNMVVQLLKEAAIKTNEIAEDIEGEALTTLAVNKTRGIFHVLGIRAPSFGARRDAVLEDIAILTGGQVISEKAGRKLESATLADLGQASSVTTTKVSTVI